MLTINNVDSKLIDDLKQTLTPGSRVVIAASSFSIYAFQALRKELEGVAEVRFLFTSPAFITEKAEEGREEYYIQRRNERESNLTNNEYEIRLRNELTQRGVAKDCADWIHRKVRFKSYSDRMDDSSGFILTDHALYTPIIGFSSVDLGITRGKRAITMITKIEDSEILQQYARQFEQCWNDANGVEEVTHEVIDRIGVAYRENAPELIYYITLQNIFSEFLEDLTGGQLPNEATGFKDTLIWNKLYPFQKEAALAIMGKLDKYNGCILADSVGLGKTFTALSVIKYYEIRNRRALVLCPKKLSDNWGTYRSNYLDNPLLGDRFAFDVLYHTDLGRSQGKSNGNDLERYNWSNCDLIVIDESHNFRNGGNVNRDEDDDNPKMNRYQWLLEEVINKGVKKKILMLSATPVNNRFHDLKNQLRLAYVSLPEPPHKILKTESSIDAIISDAQNEYNQWAKLPIEERTASNLMDRLSQDFFKLLDCFTIARSRRHIGQSYDTTDIGSFPQRLNSIQRTPDLTDLDGAISYSEIAEQIQQLNLMIYMPSLYIYPSFRDLYGMDVSDDDDTWNARKRDSGVQHLIRINLLKRLESSVEAFRCTIQRTIQLIERTLEKIERQKDNSTLSLKVDQIADSDSIDEDSEELFLKYDKNNIPLSHIDQISWKNDIQKDRDILISLLNRIKEITPEHDAKLLSLRSDLRKKWDNPINEGNKKVIIFTAFSETARYLYNALEAPIKQQYGLNTLMVTGSGIYSTLPKKKGVTLSFERALTLFSPQSKNKGERYGDDEQEFDVLIATDCISEGQNLQDCDFLINYDIHWNPVRIVQRFGRIDRIGSLNKNIQLVNYWPNIELDKYIALKERVDNRMTIVSVTGSGEANPITNEQPDETIEFRSLQLIREQDKIIDLEDMDCGISITDFGLDEFRMDLSELTKTRPSQTHAPKGLCAVIPSSTLLPPGVIFVLCNRNEGINIDKTNRLHPFYLVYVSEQGEIIHSHLAPKKILDALRSACKNKIEPDAALYRQFNRDTRNGHKMEAYGKLLQKAVESIVSVKTERDIDSLFSLGDSNNLSGAFKGLDDFELISFFVIR